MFKFLSNFIFVDVHQFRLFILQIFNLYLKWIDLFFQPITFAIKHLSHRWLFLYQNLNFIVFLIEGTLQFIYLCLQAVRVFLLVDTHLLDLAFVYSVYFNFKSVFLSLGYSFKLYHFVAQYFVLSLGQYQRLFVISFLFVEFTAD
jgi:hypothetical protein